MFQFFLFGFGKSKESDPHEKRRIAQRARVEKRHEQQLRRIEKMAVVDRKRQAAEKVREVEKIINDKVRPKIGMLLEEFDKTHEEYKEAREKIYDAKKLPSYEFYFNGIRYRLKKLLVKLK